MEEWTLVDSFSAFRGRPCNYRETGKTVNKFGFFSTPEISIEKPEDTIRVVFLVDPLRQEQGMLWLMKTRGQ